MNKLDALAIVFDLAMENALEDGLIDVWYDGMLKEEQTKQQQALDIVSDMIEEMR